jgi:hypothetical protein
MREEMREGSFLWGEFTARKRVDLQRGNLHFAEHEHGDDADRHGGDAGTAIPACLATLMPL